MRGGADEMRGDTYVATGGADGARGGADGRRPGVDEMRSCCACTRSSASSAVVGGGGGVAGRVVPNLSRGAKLGRFGFMPTSAGSIRAAAPPAVGAEMNPESL